ncbi:MAG: MYXO-CTERM sorting domain-containing protein [Planctomycetota bacterium]|jgi:MYXO-CTERM domain-containing protein
MTIRRVRLSLSSDPVNGGSFVLIDLAAPITDQNIAGATPHGNDIFIAQLVIDGNAGTNDGLAPRIYVQMANLIWQDATGANYLEGYDPAINSGPVLTAVHVVPAPGAFGLLGLVGLAGMRRRRR